MKRVLILTIAAVTLAAACGSSSKPAAKPETSPTTTPARITTVRLLTHSSFAVSKAVLADFTKQTGYKVKLVQPGDAGLVVNEAILRKDNPVADAMFGVDTTFLTRALDAGIFDAYEAHGLETVPASLQADAQHRVTPIDRSSVCVDFDKSWFDHNGRPPAPASLDDLVDPRYKNLTVVENASTSSPGLAFLMATVVAKGDGGWAAYWRALRKNGVRVDDDWTAAYQTDFTAGGASGDRPIVVSYGSDPAADVVYSDPHRATPKVGVIASTCFGQTEFAGVLHGAHNVAGARALVDFLLTRRFQEDMPLQMYVNPVVRGATLPAVFTKWAVDPAHPLSIDPATISAKRSDWIKEWTNLVVR
ncbi:MAG TPA: thiamine ABC transporter substrate-binding protein [Acidimicrobiia bacterium]|nr:thiamine ABC transporter substrate-binding protein [Acidimicrobiia bacterium]